MQWLLMFLCDFGLVFVPALCVSVLVWYGRRVSLGSMASSVGARRYPELAGFPSDDKERLLRAADRQAYAAWRFAIPPIRYAAIMAASIAAVKAGRDVWSSFGLGMLIALLGTFLGRRLEMGRIRRFLRLPLTNSKLRNSASP